MKKISLANIPVLFEDENLIILDKPAPLLTIPDRFNHAETNLAALLRSKFNDIFVVHRLDRETSGVILFAKNAESHRKLCAAFEDRLVRKKYLAIVNGTPKETKGIIELSIDEHPSKKGTMIISKKGKESVTEFSVLESLGNFSLVEAVPFTGRTHQIRVHLHAIGHPLAVDPVYGTRKELYLSEIKRKFKTAKETEEQPLVSRCTLHSCSLTFPHPVSGEMITVESPLPRDMNALLAQLRKKKA
jgi:23S rRNA pseudouridine1911/1915/1917 synthase